VLKYWGDRMRSLSALCLALGLALAFAGAAIAQDHDAFQRASEDSRRAWLSRYAETRELNWPIVLARSDAWSERWSVIGFRYAPIPAAASAASSPLSGTDPDMTTIPGHRWIARRFQGGHNLGEAVEATDADSCPQILDVLARAERLRAPRIDIPQVGRALRRPETAVFDGDDIRLWVYYARYDAPLADGGLELSSTNDTPLAAWANETEAALAPCCRHTLKSRTNL
jgi:hypothetical protein